MYSEPREGKRVRQLRNPARRLYFGGNPCQVIFRSLPVLEIHEGSWNNQSYDIYGLLTKCEVKIAGYWPSSFSACLWTEAEPRRICFILSAHGASHIFDKVKLLSYSKTSMQHPCRKNGLPYLKINLRGITLGFILSSLLNLSFVTGVHAW